MLGHTKTILILCISWLTKQTNPNIVMWRQYVGAVLAITGMIFYNRFTTGTAEQQDHTTKKRLQSDAAELKEESSV